MLVKTEPFHDYKEGEWLVIISAFLAVLAGWFAFKGTCLLGVPPAYVPIVALATLLLMLVDISFAYSNMMSYEGIMSAGRVVLYSLAYSSLLSRHLTAYVAVFIAFVAVFFMADAYKKQLIAANKRRRTKK